jgi:hypothetical protein
MAGKRLVSWVSGVVGLAVAALVMACTAATGGTTSGPASWQLVGTGSLNHTATRDADKPSIVARGDVELLLAWEEFEVGTRTLPVRRFASGAWTAASLLEADAEAIPNPATGFMGSTPHVAWQEFGPGLYDEVKLAAFNGGAWIKDADTPSVQDSKTVAIAGTTSAIHLAWFEFFDSNGDTVDEPWILYSTYSGGAFSAPEPAAPTGIFFQNPSLALYQGAPYVAYADISSGTSLVHVRRKDGANWVAVGGPLNLDQNEDAEWPSIAFVGAIPYVGWAERIANRLQVMVAHFDGSAWVFDSISLNENPKQDAGLGPRGLGLASDGSSLYVAFWESGTPNRVYVKRLSDGVWTLVGGEPLNVEANRNASYASIAVAAGVPYVAFLEDVDSGAGAFQQVFVKAFR